MNKYKAFYKELKTFLLENELEQKSNFIEISEVEIDKVSNRIPLAYKEWLKIFGSINYLLNFPYFEDYSLEKFIEVQDEEEALIQFDEHDKYLLLITSEGSLYVYIALQEENPAIYFFRLQDVVSKQNFKFRGRFTTHIRLHILALMSHLKNLNKLPVNIQWFNDESILEKLQSSQDSRFSEIEKIEDEHNRFFSIPELISFFNS